MTLLLLKDFHTSIPRRSGQAQSTAATCPVLFESQSPSGDQESPHGERAKGSRTSFGPSIEGSSPAPPPPQTRASQNDGRDVAIIFQV